MAAVAPAAQTEKDVNGASVTRRATDALPRIPNEEVPLEKVHPAVAAVLGAPPARPEPAVYVVFRTAFIACVCVLLFVGGFVINVLQLLTLPVALFSARASHRLNALVTLYSWSLTDQMVPRMANARITLSGIESLPAGESALVVANHVYWGDFFVLHTLARSKGMLSYCRYFAKDSLKYVPVFGWGMYMCNMVFLARDWRRDSGRIAAALARIVDNALPVWLVSFVEGSRITPAKLAASRAYAQAHPGAPVLTHVLLPRSKGFAATVRAMRRAPHVRHVYDVTLAFWHARRGFGAVPSPWEVLTGRIGEYRMHAHVDRIALADVPDDDAGVCRFLYARFEAKDALMADLARAYSSM